MDSKKIFISYRLKIFYCCGGCDIKRDGCEILNLKSCKLKKKTSHNKIRMSINDYKNIKSLKLSRGMHGNTQCAGANKTRGKV